MTIKQNLIAIVLIAVIIEVGLFYSLSDTRHHSIRYVPNQVDRKVLDAHLYLFCFNSKLDRFDLPNVDYNTALSNSTNHYTLTSIEDLIIIAKISNVTDIERDAYTFNQKNVVYFFTSGENCFAYYLYNNPSVGGEL